MNTAMVDIVSITGNDVLVKFREEPPASIRGTLLLDFEEELNKTHPDYRVWLKPMGDKNSLRNLRGITIK